jgi:hypothetical protein
MARGGGRSSGRSTSPRSSGSFNNTRSTAQAVRPPQTTTQSMPMQSQGGNMMGGIGSTIMTGMAFGGGSEIGHQVIKSVMGNGSSNKEQVPVENTNNNNTQQNTSSNPCQSFNMKFVECLKMSNNDIAQCQNIFDDLKICEKSFKI